jgi:hypothetical protein
MHQPAPAIAHAQAKARRRVGRMLRALRLERRRYTIDRQQKHDALKSARAEPELGVGAPLERRVERQPHAPFEKPRRKAAELSGKLGSESVEFER